jgi:hypothetical protein
MAEPVVILWWGCALRILGADGSTASSPVPVGADPVATIVEAAARAAGGARTARIIHQPDSVELHEWAFPDSARPRLRRILSRRFGALEEPGACWAAHPASGEGTGLVLIDPCSILPRLAAALGAAGLVLEGAWDLPALVDTALPPDGDGHLALLAAGGRAAVSCASSSGGRTFRLFEGPELAESAVPTLRACAARFEDGARPGILAVAEDAPGRDSLLEALPTGSAAPVPLEEFLAHARRLPPGDLSDFMARPGFWARALIPGRAMAAGGAILMIAAAAVAARARAGQAVAQRETSEWREEHARLERWVAARLPDEARIARLETAIARASSPAAPTHGFLVLLARATPPTVVLRSVVVRDGAFVVTGRVTGPEAGFAEALGRLRAGLRAPGEPWTVGEPLPGPGPAAFTIGGTFSRLPAATTGP